MKADGMALLDVQWCTEHLASLGAVEIPRQEYLVRLADATRGLGLGTPGEARD
jgi:leucyl/phenylalanyl-tRNA--protein transferase